MPLFSHTQNTASPPLLGAGLYSTCLKCSTVHSLSSWYLASIQMHVIINTCAQRLPGNYLELYS
jgi:hypothetical protein